MTITEIEIINDQVPGRTRFRAQKVCGSALYAHVVQERLGKQPGVTHVSASKLTGSVLVEYDADRITADLLLDELAGATGVTVPKPSTNGHAKPRSDSRFDKWHNLSVGEVASELQTSLDTGLSHNAATERLHKSGPNNVPDIPRRPRGEILRDQVLSVPLLMLSVAGVFSFLTGAVVDAAFIGAAIIANAALGYFTEDRAEQSIQSLRQSGPTEASVLRDGRRAKVNAEGIVPGDILLLESGQVAAADGRVAKSDKLLMDESLLTGESDAQAKMSDLLAADGVSHSERSNMVFAGSAVSAGRGTVVVTSTGLRTEIGRIRTLIGQAVDTPPPMSRELQRLGGALALMATACCGVFAAIGLAMGLPALEVMAVTASLAVSAIPEGLPTVATTTLALGMQRMRQKNVVIRRLPAVGALGSATILCVDKTGTLTHNRMAVRAFVLGDAEIDVTPTRDGGASCLRKGKLVSPEQDFHLMQAFEVCVLCTEADWQQDRDGQWEAVGSATESALLVAGQAAGLDIAQMTADHAVLERQQREVGRNYMATLHRHLNGGYEVFVKGAPGEVLGLCDRELRGDAPVPLLKERRNVLISQNVMLASRGMRMLGMAHAELPSADGWEGKPLTWIGLVGLEDPLRDEAGEAILGLAKAGIKTIMLTGDQMHTAEAVGRAAGLGREGRALRVADASAIAHFLDTGEKLPDVLARVSPAHKFEIVQLLQRRGHVVMMTGDGVNDAPALKAADIGVAMGSRSTQIARDLADVILLDDNLASLPIAVSQGRTIFSNIRKALRFLLASNLADILLVGATLVLGLSFPLSALQLLWMNLVTDVFPAIALAMEPSEADTMMRPPRAPKEPLLTRDLWKIIGREAALIAGATLGVYVWGLGRYGVGARTRTLAFTTVCLSEILYALACRTSKVDTGNGEQQPNRFLTGFLAIAAVAQMATIFVSPLRALFGLTFLTVADWLVVGGSSFAVLALAKSLQRLPRFEMPKQLLLSAPSDVKEAAVATS